MTETIRLLVADDHTLLRGALCDALELEPDLEVVAEADNGGDTVGMALEHRPDVVILDLQMPGQDVLTTVEQLGDRAPWARVLILSMHDDPPLVQQMLQLGVSGYLHKSASRETLVSAIRTARRGDQQVLMALPRRSLNAAEADPPATPGPLSVRELEVLTFVAKALSNRQIAKRLGIAEGTVKRHMRNIFGKLGAVSRIDAVNKAAAASLIATATEQA